MLGNGCKMVIVITDLALKFQFSQKLVVLWTCLETVSEEKVEGIRGRKELQGHLGDRGGVTS